MYQTVSRVDKEEGVSESLVRRSFTEEAWCQLGANEEKPKASRVIRLDEFSIKKRMFNTSINDLKERKVLGKSLGQW